MSNRKQFLNALVVSSAILVSAGCSESKTAEEYQAEIQQYLDKNDYKSASVTLKNAIKIAPENANFRYELGLIYLNDGDYANAEKELEQAEHLGLQIENLYSRLAEVKFKLGKFEEVYQLTKTAQHVSDTQYVQIITYAGLSALYQGDRGKAVEFIDNANQISSESIYGQIGKAFLTTTRVEAEKSLKVLDSFIAYEPDIVEPYLLKAYLLQGTKEYLAAAQAFQTYHDKRPREVQIKFFIAQNYLLAQQIEKAEPIVDELLKLSEHHPLTNQMKGQIEFDRKNFQAAREYSVKAYQQSEKFKLAIILAGVSAYYLGEYEQAYNDLIKIKDQLSDHHLVKKILLELQLRLGYDDQAVENLNQLLVEGNVTSETLLTASKEFLSSGKDDIAKELLQQSINLNDSNAEQTIEQGLLKIRLNDLASGIDLFEKAVDVDPDSIQAEANLAVSYLVDKQYKKALIIAKKWQANDAQKVQGLLLEAEIANKQKQDQRYQDLLIQVLNIENRNTTALYKLATYWYKKEDINKAFDFYVQLLSAKPDHIRGIINFTRLLASSAQLQRDAIAFYQQQIAEAEDKRYYQFGLAFAHRVSEQHDKSLILFKEIVETEPAIDGIEIAIGDTYFYLRDFDKSEDWYRQLLDKQPDNVLATGRLLNLYNINKEYGKSIELLTKLSDYYPDNLSLVLRKIFYQSLAKTAIDNNDIEQLKTSTAYQDHWMLNKVIGTQAYRNKKLVEAISYYEKAYEAYPSSLNIVDLARAYSLVGEHAKAINLFKELLLKAPNDISAKTLLAGVYLNAEQTQQAKSLYLDILKAQPNNIIALNNLAYISLQQKNDSEALLFAENAHKLAPNKVAVLDTYAQSLVANKQIKEGLAIYEQALKIENDNIEIKINYAKAYILDNQVDKAKDLLKSIAMDNVSPEQKLKIDKLLKTQN